MIRLNLPASLALLVPDDPARERRPSTSIVLAASSWTEVVEELQQRFPQLARRVLEDSGRTTEGFVLVVNGEIERDGRPATGLSSGDEVLILPQLAGG